MLLMSILAVCERNKIEDDPRKPQTVVTVWGIGYKLGASV